MKHASFSDRQRVRYIVANLFDTGLSHAEIARRFGISRQSVCRWYKLWLDGGEAGLKVKKAGSTSLTNDEQWQQIQDALLKGPAAHGYDTEFWTLDRIADLVYKITGVKYHQGHIWKLLRKLGWSHQKPEKRAKQRDEEAIARWVVERWPQIKRGQSNKEPD